MWLILLHENDLLLHICVDNRTSELVLFRLDNKYFIIRMCNLTFYWLVFRNKMQQIICVFYM